MKQCLIILICLLGISSHAQSTSRNFRTKTVTVKTDTIRIDSVSINPYAFKILDSVGQLLDSTNYKVDFATAVLIIDHRKYHEIVVEYYALPQFLTKKYSIFNKDLIVPKKTDISKLYSLKKSNNNQFFKPFDGLSTSGSISRGFTVGNNQDAVLNSNLDLQISGYLSDKVQLRASITDTNIPLQEGGYTQRLDEFDRVFIELLSDNWRIKAGDVNLQNDTSTFMRFNKKVAGVAVNATLNHDDSKTDAFASGAIVRGQFARNTLTGQEANQGPYRITGNNTDQLVLIVSGSETVFVNGIPLKRGENYDYTIDYNTAEITFTPTFPITANMRIIVEYQFTDRNFTRFITYNGANYTSDKLKVGFTIFNENDAKNQTLQQDLTDTQREILANAGDDLSQMVVPSARAETFNENSILYRKELINGVEAFVFSTNENDALFNVRFSFIGLGLGNYIIETTVATGRIFKYIVPINGVSQGEYEPVVQLIAPNKLQVTTINAAYTPSENTNIYTELAYSANDQNLFSSLNDSDNTGFAGKLNWNQLIADKKWKIESALNYEFIENNFKTVERFRNIEFNRDWDIVNPLGSQQLFEASISFEKDSVNNFNYSFENLRFSENFNGIKHNLRTKLHVNNTHINATGSLLKNNTSITETDFLRWYSVAKQDFNGSWIGGKFNAEYNDRKDILTGISSNLGHKFIEYEAFAGLGDTAKVFVEVGYNFRATDSVRVNDLQKVNSTNTYFLRSSLIQNKNTNLSIYANYRTIDNTFKDDEEAFNSRLIYRQQLFNNAISLSSVYETNSGTLPQQEFSYLEVEPGQGFYTWIDYNDNGVQELDEFEVAQFADQAIYVRVLLPSINFIKTHQNKFSQSLTVNPSRWKSKKGFKKFVSHFINQSFVLIDSKQERVGTNFNLNPFDISDDVLGLNLNMKNSLFFNRGRQYFSTTYTYLDARNRTSFSTGAQENNTVSHQLQFIHKLGAFWLFDLKGIVSENESISENFATRNYVLKNRTVNPILSYIYNKNARFEAFYQLKNKENQINDLETLTQHNVGANFLFSNKERSSINASVNLFYNDFVGNENSAVAFQILEGLQPGTNYTWNLGLQRKITSYLDINLNYLGRKSETSKTIHTGTIQLRASF
jgi:hypothetical protein